MSDINLVVYPQGPARCVIQLDQFVELLTDDQLVYLNGKLASKLIDTLTKEEDND